MRVCFVRLEKFEKRENEEVNGSFKEKLESLENFFRNFLGFIKYKIHFYMNFVKKDRYSDEILVSNFNEESVKKINKILKKEKYNFAITENNEDIKFPSLDGSMITRFLLPEIKNFVFNIVKPSLDEIYICVNEYNNENTSIILDLINSSKSVNIITENQLYYYWERQMEKKEIYLNVTSNKRKALKKASIIINLDYKSLMGFNINRSAIIVDTTSNMQFPQGFDGIVIKKCKINTKKILRIFAELPEFNKEELLIYELLKGESTYSNVRNKILQDKIFIEEIYNKRKIETQELKQLKEKTLAK